MTLIAAWKSPNGIVIHADSQETVGIYRKTVQKITPETMGRFEVISAGSGPGELIDSFVVRLRRAFQNDLSIEIAHFVEVAEHVLADFYAFDVTLSPLPDDEKQFKLIIAASCPASYSYGTWFTAGVTLTPLQSLELSGWDEPLYINVARRFYSDKISIAQAVVAGVYLLTLAEGTSQYVRGPISIAVVRENGIWMDKPAYIDEIAARLRDYDERINQVFLACSDTSIHVSKLEEMLQEFANAALLLHRTHIDRSVTLGGLEGLMRTNDAYPKRPLDSVVTGMGDGRLVFEHDPEKLKERMKFFEHMRQMTLNSPHYVLCPSCNAELEYVLATPGQNKGPGEATCPECQVHVRTPLGRASKIRKIVDGGGGQWIDVSESEGSQ